MDGARYREFLALLRKKLPDKIIAIAAPASYWYLRGFPIAEISKIVNYIVYMAYDLHGQWDYGNAWSSPVCQFTFLYACHLLIQNRIGMS
jgi:chitinase